VSKAGCEVSFIFCKKATDAQKMDAQEATGSKNFLKMNISSIEGVNCFKTSENS